MRRSTKELIKKVNAFLDTIDDFESVTIEPSKTIDIKKVEKDKRCGEFQCSPTTKEIEIDPRCQTYEYGMFLDTLYERNNVPWGISLFTWALLHEVGHCMTEHLLDTRANNHCQYVKHKIEKGKKPHRVYYFLADEKRATNWAIRFVRNNYDEVKKFDNDIRGYLYANL